MIRGTTPTITLDLPANVPVSNIDEAVFSIAQDGEEVIQKRLSDMTLDVSGNTLQAWLTQEDTFKLKEGRAEMQLKLSIGLDVLASAIAVVSVAEILNEEEI